MQLKGINQDILKKILNDIGTNYTTSISYNPGAYVIKDAQLYKAKVNTSTTWVASEWDAINIMSQFTDTGTLIAEEPWDSTKQYHAGDIVQHDNKVYKCLVQDATIGKIETGSAGTVHNYNITAWDDGGGGLMAFPTDDGGKWIDTTDDSFYIEATWTVKGGTDTLSYTGKISTTSPAPITGTTTNYYLVCAHHMSIKSADDFLLYCVDTDYADALQKNIDTCTLKMYYGYKAAEWKQIYISNSPNLTCIAPEYDEEVQYYLNDIIIHDGKCYYLKGKSMPGPWNPDEWTECPLSKLLIYDAIAPIWNVYTPYGEGKWTVYRGHLYICVVEQATIGQFKDDEWTKVSIDENLNTMVKSIIGWIAPVFNEADHYEKHALVIHLDNNYDPTACKLYRALDNITPGPWDDSKWEQTNLAEVKYDFADANSIAEEWANDATYAIGDIVMYKGKLCKAVQTPTPGAFLNDEWDLTCVMNEVSGGGEKGIAPDYDATISYQNGVLYEKNKQVMYSAGGGVTPADDHQSTAFDYVNAFIKATSEVIKEKYGLTATWGWDSTNNIPTFEFKSAAAGKYFTASPTYALESNAATYNVTLYSPDKASTVTDKYIIIGDKVNYRIPVGKRLKIKNNDTSEYSLITHSYSYSTHGTDDTGSVLIGTDVTNKGSYDVLPSDIEFPAEGQVTKNLAVCASGCGTIKSIDAKFTTSDNVYTYAYPILDSTTRLAHTFYIQLLHDPGTVTEETITAAMSNFEFTLEDDDTTKGYFAEVDSVVGTSININKKTDGSSLLLSITSSNTVSGTMIRNNSGDLSKYEYKVACIWIYQPNNTNVNTVAGYKCFNRDALTFYKATRVFGGSFKGKYMQNDGTTPIVLTKDDDALESFVSNWMDFNENLKFVVPSEVCTMPSGLNNGGAICFIMVRHKDGSPITMDEGGLFEVSEIYSKYGGADHIYTNYSFSGYTSTVNIIHNSGISTNSPLGINNNDTPSNDIGGSYINQKLYHIPKNKMMVFTPQATISQYLTRTLYVVHSADIIDTMWNLDADGNYIFNIENANKYGESFRVFNNEITKVVNIHDCYASGYDDVYILEHISYSEPTSGSAKTTLKYNELEAYGALTTMQDAPIVIPGDVNTSTKKIVNRTSTNSFIALGSVKDWDTSKIYRTFVFAPVSGWYDSYIKGFYISKSPTASVTSAFTRVEGGYKITDDTTSDLTFSTNPSSEVWSSETMSSAVATLIPANLNNDFYYGIVISGITDLSLVLTLVATMKVTFDDRFTQDHLVGKYVTSENKISVLNTTSGSIHGKGFHKVENGTYVSLNEDYDNECIGYIFEGPIDTTYFNEDGTLKEEYRSVSSSINLSTMTLVATIDNHTKSYNVMGGGGAYILLQNLLSAKYKNNITAFDAKSLDEIMVIEEPTPASLTGATIALSDDTIQLNIIPDTEHTFVSSYIMNAPFGTYNSFEYKLKVKYDGSDTGVNIKAALMSVDSIYTTDDLVEKRIGLCFKDSAQTRIDAGTAFYAAYDMYDTSYELYNINTSNPEQLIEFDYDYYLVLSFSSTTNTYTYEQVKNLIKIEYVAPDVVNGYPSANIGNLYWEPYNSDNYFAENKFRKITEDKTIYAYTKDTHDQDVSVYAQIYVIRNGALNDNFIDNGDNTYSLKSNLSSHTQIGTCSNVNSNTVYHDEEIEMSVNAGDIVCVVYQNSNEDPEIIDQIKDMYAITDVSPVRPDPVHQLVYEDYGELYSSTYTDDKKYLSSNSPFMTYYHDEKTLIAYTKTSHESAQSSEMFIAIITNPSYLSMNYLSSDGLGNYKIKKDYPEAKQIGNVTGDKYTEYSIDNQYTESDPFKFTVPANSYIVVGYQNESGDDTKFDTIKDMYYIGNPPIPNKIHQRIKQESDGYYTESFTYNKNYIADNSCFLQYYEDEVTVRANTTGSYEGSVSDHLLITVISNISESEFKTSIVTRTSEGNYRLNMDYDEDKCFASPASASYNQYEVSDLYSRIITVPAGSYISINYHNFTGDDNQFETIKAMYNITYSGMTEKVHQKAHPDAYTGNSFYNESYTDNKKYIASNTPFIKYYENEAVLHAYTTGTHSSSVSTDMFVAVIKGTKESEFDTTFVKKTDSGDFRLKEDYTSDKNFATSYNWGGMDRYTIDTSSSTEIEIPARSYVIVSYQNESGDDDQYDTIKDMYYLG